MGVSENEEQMEHYAISGPYNGGRVGSKNHYY
jgi:hypothetical protein